MVKDDETYEFVIISSFARNVRDKNGNDVMKVLKPEVTYKMRCNLADVTVVLESFNRNGGISKGRCCIWHKEYKELLVRGDYKKICGIVFSGDEEPKIGYGRSK